MTIKLIPEEDQDTKRRKKWIYDATEISLDKDMSINIKYGILEIQIEDYIHLPQCCGAYVITTKSGYLYVGSSRNVRRRIVEHIKQQVTRQSSSIIEPIEKIRVYVVETPFDARILEFWLMKELKPRLNAGFIVKNNL